MIARRQSPSRAAAGWCRRWRSCRHAQAPMPAGRAPATALRLFAPPRSSSARCRSSCAASPAGRQNARRSAKDISGTYQAPCRQPTPWQSWSCSSRFRIVRGWSKHIDRVTPARKPVRRKADGRPETAKPLLTVSPGLIFFLRTRAMRRQKLRQIKCLPYSRRRDLRRRSFFRTLPGCSLSLGEPSR